MNETETGAGACFTVVETAFQLDFAFSSQFFQHAHYGTHTEGKNLEVLGVTMRNVLSIHEFSYPL